MSLSKAVFHAVGTGGKLRGRSSLPSSRSQLFFWDLQIRQKARDRRKMESMWLILLAQLVKRR